MLRFSRAGLMREPDTLHLRVGPGTTAPRAGAPVPTRALTDAEVLEAVHHVTARRGPRQPACTRVVLSAVPAGRAAAIGRLLPTMRGWGIAHVTVHVTPTCPVVAGVDAVVITVADAAGWAALARWPAHRVAVVPLTSSAIHGLDATWPPTLAVQRVVFTWPFPPHGTPAPVHEVRAVLPGVVARVDAAGVPWTVKGLPPCVLGLGAERAAASRNRLYVDAAHQGDDALLFFPDVVQLHKAETCRFCPVDARCDGVAAGWMAACKVPALDPRGLDEAS